MRMTEKELNEVHQRNGARLVHVLPLDEGRPGPKVKPRKVSPLEFILQSQLKAAKIEGWLSEYQFHPERRWRVDLAWPERILAVEIEGGTWIKGAHSTGSGIERDMAKSNALALMGWRLLRFTGKQVKNGTAIQTIKEALA